MPKIPESDITQIKNSVDLVSLCQSRNILLKKTGKNYFGKCPFHDDDKASFTVNPKENLFHCFGCNTGGDVIRFVELLDKCSFKEAVATLSKKAIKEAVKEENNHSFSSRDQCISGSVSSLNRSKLLSLVADFYHAAFNQRKDGKEYLAKRGITDLSLLSRFKAGFCAGSIRESIPKDGKMLDDLKTLGVITQDNREFFKNCIVFSIPDETGKTVNLYGRRIRNGQVNHLYLPGPKTGVFNSSAVKSAETIIFVESILDALALIQAGYPGAIPIYGSNGLPQDHIELIRNNPGKPIYLCFDGDDAGRVCTAKVKTQLASLGIDARTILLPETQDPCSIFLENDGKDIFRKRFRQAGGQLHMDLNNKGIYPSKILHENGCLQVVFPDLTFEVKHQNGDKPRSRITLKVFKTDDRISLNHELRPAGATTRFHLDTIDLYSARSRAFFARTVAEIFSLRDAQISSELLALIEPIENNLKESRQNPEPSKPSMSDQERKEALSLLTAPDLFDRILHDFETVGITGEETNKLMGYIAAVSRKLSEPLSICIQSRSAAGKSALQDAILNFMPPEDVVRYTKLTGQALFYKAGDSLKHKILAIEEAVGAKDANYSIRTMQSSKRLSTASAGRDPQTGKLRTDEYFVDGPAAVFETTTEPEMESETASRFVFLTIDESREATARIHAAQREMDTLDGMRLQKKAEAVIRLHQNAQRLLEDGLKVINPYSPYLTFTCGSLRARRDNKKYLAMIKAIAYLRQHQREIKTDETDGQRYIEVILDDIRIANDLASEILGRSLDELSPPSRKLLELIHEMVIARSMDHGIDPKEYSFSRRDIREYSGWSDFQVKTHIRQLEDLEYLYSVTGRKGKEYVYELRCEPGIGPGQKFLAGLVNVDELAKKLEKSGKDGTLGGVKQ